MQSQTAFYFIGQVLTVDLCLRHARLVLNLVYILSQLLSHKQLSFDGQCNRIGLQMKKVLKCVHVHTLLKGDG